MREQVVGLEDDADPLAHRVGVDVAGGDLDVVDEHRPRVDVLEPVDAAQQRRLARPGRTDQADHVSAVDLEAHAAQHRVRAERLVQPTDPQQRLGHAAPPASCRRRSRARSRSVNRASGMVSAMNSSAATT